MQQLLRITLLTLSIGQFLLADAQGFNRRYDAWGQARPENAVAVEATPYGALVLIGAGYINPTDSLYYTPVATTLAIDLNGEPIDTNMVFIPSHSTFVGLSNSLFHIPGLGFGAAGAMQDSAYTADPLFYQFDDNGVPQNVSHYPLAVDVGDIWGGSQGKKTLDGGYIIVGECAVDGGDFDPFLLKLDSSGGMEWFKVYGDTTLSERARSVVQGTDGGFYISGRRDSPTDWVPFVIHTDSLGNELWDIGYNDPNIQESANLEGLSNGDLVFASSWRKHAQATYPDHVGLKRITETGSVVWSKQYGEFNGGSAGLLSVKELGNGDLISTGYGWINNSNKGALLRVNAQGDSLWMRHYYYYDSLWTEGQGYFFDVAPTSDGGFIAVGTASSQSNNPNDYNLAQYSQDTWVVKVDSMGCIVPGCDSLSTSISTQVTGLSDAIRVYPNPIASGEMVVIEIDIPEQFSSEVVYLTLLNSIGQRIEEMQVTSTRIEFSAPIDAGLYYLHLTSGSIWLAGKKVVVE